MKPIHTAKGALLLCLDIQPVFLKAVIDGDRVLGRCQFAVASAVGLGIPVSFTEQVPAKLGTTEATLFALAGRAEVHTKETFSALAQGSLIRQWLLIRFRTSSCLASFRLTVCMPCLPVSRR